MSSKRVIDPHISLRRPNRTEPKSLDPAGPLSDAKRELFAQRVAEGMPVKQAYEMSGYTGKRVAMHDVRRHPAVEARINWLLQERVRADARHRHRTEKKIDDLRLRTLRELERIAFSDTRDFVQWERKPIFAEDGTVTGFRDELTPTPSHRLTEEQAAAVKSITTKSGALKIDLHDKLLALEKLGKALGLFQDAAPAPAASLTVNQVNIGDMNAIDAARRVAFLIRSAAALAPTAPQLVLEQPVPDEAQAESDKT